MNRNLMRCACLVMLALCTVARSMDRLQLNFWKIAPRDLQPPQLEALKGSIGTQALTRYIPVYNQHWAYVGILIERGRDDVAINHRDSVMPPQIRDEARRATIQQITARLEELLAKVRFTVFDVMQAWACIALLCENNAGQAAVRHRDRLLAILGDASLPADYERMVQQRNLAAQAAAARQAGPADPVQPAQTQAPAQPAPGPTQSQRAQEIADRLATIPVPARAPVPAHASSASSQRPAQVRSAHGPMRLGLRDFLQNQQYTIDNRLDALQLLVADCYSDFYEYKIDRDAMLDQLAYIHWVLARRRLAAGTAIGSMPAAPVQDIQEIIRTHAKASRCDEPVGTAGLNIGDSFPDLHINGEVVTSLQQGRSEDDPTSLCGYFALHNALEFDWRDEAARLNRGHFAQFFGNCLQTVHENRKHGPYGNIDARELRNIINNQGLEETHIVVIEMGNLAAYTEQHPELELMEALEDERDAALLQDFINGAIPALSIIAGLGDGFGHWIAIHATRNAQGIVSIKVADSLHPVNFYNNRDMIIQRILPFYLL